MRCSRFLPTEGTHATELYGCDQTRWRVVDRLDRGSTGVNCQESSREALVETLRVTLREALELNRQEALGAAGGNFEEASIAV
jgi:hypothetical protein